jgi:hypothetical protein
MLEITLTEENQNLLEILKLELAKDANTILNDALKLYFKTTLEELDAKRNSQSDLSFDEFWDGVEV